MSDLHEQLERAQADGRITVDDADEVRTFAAFLEACGPHHTSPDFDRERFARAYKEHYPEEYARAMKEQEAHRFARRVERIRSGGNQFGHGGLHHGTGAPDCPRERHHHHDEFCKPPTPAEWAAAGRTGEVQWGSRA